MTEVEFKAVINALVPAIKDVFHQAHAELQTKIAALEQVNQELRDRVIDLEASRAAARRVPHGEP